MAELRAIGRDGRIASGYFDDPALLAEKAEALDESRDCQGIYLTLNPVNPALLSRRANRLQNRLGRKDATTADADIVRRRWLPVDIDPVRPSGVSSTGDEHRAAVARAEAVRECLSGQGWPAPIVADSGNGAHLLYRVDLPNDDESTALVKAVLGTLDARFSTAAAKVDTANFNAARIWKLYGTVSRKGDFTADRPHRRSAVAARPAALEVVPTERLRALSGALPAPDQPPAAAGKIDLGAWLAAHGVAVTGEKPWQGGTLYTLAQCPFSDAHADGAFAVQFPNGAVHAGCKHDSCGSGRQRWRELRARFETGPPAPVAPPGAASEAEADPEAVAAAREVLERGDPMTYFLAAFGRDHVGDETLAHCLITSIASQAVRNTKGLHVYVTGESGKGKSSGMTAMLRQVPEEYRLAERMSNKALYYSDDINPGTVLMLDDIALSEELQEVLKEATSKFTEPVRMRTVDTDRKVRRYAIPERCVWWLANVSALYDEQVLNRMLTCWVDDSEEQDREVFRRRMADVVRDEDAPPDDRLDLRVCRAAWRMLKADGTVRVRVPFADRIGMASVSNRRNPDVLLDLVRSHALVFRFQREQHPLDDGGLAVVATEDDFRYAARLFADLHTTAGSLESKFDRNEQYVLSLAARNRVEQFTVRDLQAWTGWTYRKARRLLVGHVLRGVQYPGLIDKSPALSPIDQTTVAPDGEGPDVRRRQLVFAFDPEVYRESCASGQVWLKDEGSVDTITTGYRVDRGVDRPIGGASSPGSTNDPHDGPLENGSVTTPRIREHDGDGNREPPALCSVDTGDRRGDEMDDPAPYIGSKGDAPPGELAATAINTLFSGASDERAVADLRAFAPLAAPAPEPCSACGRSPSHYREARPKGVPRRLCRACRAAAVRREQRAGPPLPGAIDPGALRRVAASVGRCDVCDLEAAAWSGGGVRLCDACFRREVRRRIARGEDISASA